MPLAWKLRLPVPSKIRWSLIWVLVSVQYFWEQFFLSVTLNKIPAPLSEGRGQSILSWSSWAYAMPYCWFSVQICLEELRAHIDLSVSDSFRRLWSQVSTISVAEERTFISLQFWNPEAWSQSPGLVPSRVWLRTSGDSRQFLACGSQPFIFPGPLSLLLSSSHLSCRKDTCPWKAEPLIFRS